MPEGTSYQESLIRSVREADLSDLPAGRAALIEALVSCLEVSLQEVARLRAEVIESKSLSTRRSSSREAAQAVLERSGRGLRLSEIVTELRSEGFFQSSKNPSAAVGMLFHRHPRLFVQKEGLWYVAGHDKTAVEEGVP